MLRARRIDPGERPLWSLARRVAAAACGVVLGSGLGAFHTARAGDGTGTPGRIIGSYGVPGGRWIVPTQPPGSPPMWVEAPEGPRDRSRLDPRFIVPKDPDIDPNILVSKDPAIDPDIFAWGLPAEEPTILTDRVPSPVVPFSPPRFFRVPAPGLVPPVIPAPAQPERRPGRGG